MMCGGVLYGEEGREGGKRLCLLLFTVYSAVHIHTLLSFPVLRNVYTCFLMGAPTRMYDIIIPVQCTALLR